MEGQNRVGGVVIFVADNIVGGSIRHHDKAGVGEFQHCILVSSTLCFDTLATTHAHLLHNNKTIRATEQ